MVYKIGHNVIALNVVLIVMSKTEMPTLKKKRKETEKRKVLRTKHKLLHLSDFISQFPPTTLPHELVTLPD